MIGRAIGTALLIVAANFAVGPAAADPAEVFQFGQAGCFFGWVDNAINLIGVPGEMGILVDTNNGQGTQNFVCHGQVPDNLPPPEAVFEFLDFGNGAGLFNFENTDVPCMIGDTVTFDYQQVVTPNGRVSLVCKLHP